jgi:hypothetical protein
MTHGGASPAPPCTRMGSHCDGLRVILRVATLDDGPGSADHEATWLLGHTERITFLGDLQRQDRDLYIEAMIHVPCRHLVASPSGGAACRAHGYARRGSPRPPDPAEPRQFDGERFGIVEAGRVVTRRLPPPARLPRELPVHALSNPCATAPCRTADHRRGAACCRDLQIEILCDVRAKKLEALVRSRQRPFLCKVERISNLTLGAELISACAFLEGADSRCVLHGRKRPDGRPAKPDLCSEWPDGAEVMHPGCVFAESKMRGSEKATAGPVQPTGSSGVPWTLRYTAARR